MSKQRKPYDQGKVLKLWEAGKSIKEVATAVGCSRVYPIECSPPTTPSSTRRV